MSGFSLLDLLIVGAPVLAFLCFIVLRNYRLRVHAWGARLELSPSRRSEREKEEPPRLP